jgi:hypothetical protein
MDRANKWDILMADLLYGMSQLPRHTFDEEQWEALKEVSYELSQETGFA